ncbi:MFS general substrate transporter [Wolfiporia cocos MD-104 SS10]|uniref:MFS general substrate transporter n=1 Tax=Wolfiporia cocos (strain MD-104) TaxID=742152 RepID=A0A2H3K486_WOLCO|nr:MFS general substrate transporter [Wolfiporia cocos MD-104 SS10]
METKAEAPDIPASPLHDHDTAPATDNDLNDERYHIHGHKRIIVVLALGLILFISALDSTIVSVALPVIGAYFDDYTQSSWIVTAYLITYTAFLPLVSKLTDILGRKPVLIFSTIFFMLWSGACGGAKSMVQLIVFRAMQGIGGSAIYSAVIVTISTIVPRAEVAMYTPMIGITYALSSVAGPLIGGAIVSHIHWGWIFFVNLPIGTVGGLLLLYGLKDPHQGPQNWLTIVRRIDWVGSILLLAMSVLLAFALQVGGTNGYPWVSAKVLAPLIVSACLLPLFVFVERRHPEPMVPPSLFNQRNFAFIIIFTLCLGAGFFTTTIFLPQRMEVVDLRSPISAGVRMLPQLLTLGVLSMLSGAAVVITRSYRLLLSIAAMLGAVGCGLLSTLSAHTHYSAQYGFEALVGVSVGVTIPVSTMVVQFSTPRRDLAPATGVQSFARQLGALVGIATDTALLNARVRRRLAGLPGLSAAAAEGIIQDPSGVLPKLPATQRAYVQQAYADGFSKVFIAGAAWLAFGALATLVLQHILPPELESVGRKRMGEAAAGTENARVDLGEVTHSEATAQRDNMLGRLSPTDGDMGPAADPPNSP